MSTLLVADVGNSRMKWGHCGDQRVTEAASLPLDDPHAWEAQLQVWEPQAPRLWALTGVHPGCMGRFQEWLQARGEVVQLLDGYQSLPVQVAVEHPEQVGIDRLLNAVAANSRGRRPAILVDAGSAVTVDWVDTKGVFRGGGIFPGLRLMARALHSYTARLPLVDVTAPLPAMPGTSTASAIAVGIYGAVAGGINHLIHRLATASPSPPVVYLTGGDATLLAPGLDEPFELWPFMTLEGIRLAAINLL